MGHGRRRRHQQSLTLPLQQILNLLFALSLSLSLLWLLKCWNDLDTVASSQSATTRRRSLPSATTTVTTTLIHRLIATPEDLLAAHDDEFDSAFCTFWNVTVDDWWTHHVTWEITLQNQTHQCFRPIAQTAKAALFQSLHDIQWNKAICNNDTDSAVVVFTKILSNSGWGADLAHVVDGLLYALHHDVPVDLVFPVPWQYTTARTGSSHHSVCTAADLSCYFLPLTCPHRRRYKKWSGPLNNGDNRARFFHPWHGFFRSATTAEDDHEDAVVAWLLQYATRPQTWLRHKAVDLAASLALPKPCTVLHVRRADVVLHGSSSRAYHKIAEYVRAASAVIDRNPNILLLTDDANAIPEAVAYSQKHPYLLLHWYYFQRPRHRGAEGGWENQIPSQDPEWEVVVLHATFLLIQSCNVLVHSKSNLADYYYAIMMLAAANNNNEAPITRIDLDANKPHDQIHNAQNSETVRVSNRFNAVSSVSSTAN